MGQSSSILENQKLLPIIDSNDVSEGVNVATAMARASIHIVEVVLRNDSSLALITELKKSLPHLKIAAGTVIDSSSLYGALEVGADFIVTPGLSEGLIEQLKKCPIPVLPGVSSVSDIIVARDYGFKQLKLFPATLAGGTSFLKSISTIFRDVSFCPTGGVNQENRDEFLSLSNVFAVGGTWVAKQEWIDNSEWVKITNACLLANQ